MSQNKNWQGFGELRDPSTFQKKVKDEFREELPFEDLDEGLMDAKSPRRDFLKYVGISTAAATLAASCNTPVRRAIPYANKPENIIPGEALYYATTYVQDGDVIPVLAKVRDGRPIKLEGNTSSKLSQGATSARVQASVLDLYDSNRLTHAKHKKGDKFEEVPTFEQLDKMIATEMGALSGKAIVLLSGTINSPSGLQIIQEFLAKYPGSKHIMYDAISYSGMLQANEMSMGKRSIPTYNFAQASKVIVSLGADFLGTWLNSEGFQRDYAKNRVIKDESAPEMSRHYQFESYLSMTGSNADVRFTHRPSESGKVALALYAALGGAGTAPTFSDAKLTAGIAKVAADLKAENLRIAPLSPTTDAELSSVHIPMKFRLVPVGS